MPFQITHFEEDFCDGVASYKTKYWKRYQQHYSSHYKGPDLIKKSKLHAVYHYVIEIAAKKAKIKSVNLVDVHRLLTDMKIGIAKSYNNFCSCLKQMRKQSIEDVLFHKGKGQQYVERLKLKPCLADYSEVLYVENLWSYRQITDKVNRCARHLGFDEISESTLKSYFANKERQSRLRLERNGGDWFFDNIGKKSHFTPPKYSGQLLEIDGSRYQIPFNNVEEKKIDWLNLFAILDVASTKIVGYAFGKSESSRVVLNAFRRFLNEYDFLPVQIIRDNATSYEDKFQFFEEYSTHKGVTWIHTSHAPGKPHVERFFYSFAKAICSYNEFYIGLGITTKDIDSRYTKKQIQKRVGERRHLLSLEKDLIMQGDQLIERFNSTVFDRATSPNHQFKRKLDKKKLIALSEPEIQLLTGNRKRLMVRHSEITIQFQGKKYYYQFDDTMGLKYNREEVIVAYDNTKLDCIHVFDETFKYITTIEKYVQAPFLLSERTPEENQRVHREIGARKKIVKAIKKDIKQKKSNVEQKMKTYVNFEIVHSNLSKTDHLKAQNDFTRHLFNLDNCNNESVIDQQEDNVRVISIDKNRPKRILKK